MGSPGLGPGCGEPGTGLGEGAGSPRNFRAKGWLGRPGFWKAMKVFFLAGQLGLLVLGG